MFHLVDIDLCDETSNYFPLTGELKVGCLLEEGTFDNPLSKVGA